MSLNGQPDHLRFIQLSFSIQTSKNHKGQKFWHPSYGTKLQPFCAVVSLAHSPLKSRESAGNVVWKVCVLLRTCAADCEREVELVINPSRTSVPCSQQRVETLLRFYYSAVVPSRDCSDCFFHSHAALILWQFVFGIFFHMGLVREYQLAGIST